MNGLSADFLYDLHSYPDCYFQPAVSASYSYATDRYHPLLLVTTIAVAFTAALFCLLRPRAKKPFLFSPLGGTVCYFALYMLLVCFDFKTMNFIPESLFGRLWMAGGEDALFYHLPTVLRSIRFGRIFSSGTDFSAFIEAGGSLPQLLSVLVLNFVLISMAGNDAVITSVADDAGVDASQGHARAFALACCGLINAIAAGFGCGPMQIGQTSVAGSGDRAKSGLASIVAALGFGVSIFIMVVPFLFATSFTYELEFNMYGHYGKVLQLVAQCGFAVADMVMVFVGLHMASKSLKAGLEGTRDLVPAVATVAGTLLIGNLAGGVAVGALSHILCELGSPREANEAGAFKRIGISGVLMAIVSIAVLALTLM